MNDGPVNPEPPAPPAAEPLPPSPPPPPGPVPALSLSGLASLVTAMGFLGFISIGGLTQLASVPFGLWWCELFVFFGIPFVALALSGRSPMRSTGFHNPWLAGCALGFGLGFANFFAAVAPIMFVTQKLAPKSLMDLYDSAKVFQDRTPLELAFIIGGVVIAAPLGEEFFFRGVLQRGWAERMGPIVAVVFTGAVFSAFHLDIIGFPARWELGMLFGLLAWRTGSLWPGIFAHLANNLTSTALYFALKDQPQDPSDDAMSVLAIAGIGGLMLLGVLLLARRFPQTLTAPRPLETESVPAASPVLVAQWLLAGLAAIAVLAIVDFRGSVVRAIDMVTPLKSPSAELKAQRELAVKGEARFGDYWHARQAAPKRGADAGTAGPEDAGTAK